MEDHRDSNILKDATAMIGLLKSTDEDHLEEQIKFMIKTNRQYTCKVFSTKVEEWTPFHAFVLKGYRKMVKMALKCGVDVNLRMGKPRGIPGKCSVLHLASFRGDISIIKLILNNGANINQLNDNNRTPIYYASSAGNTLAVKTLQKAGADLSQCVQVSVVATQTVVSPYNLIVPFICLGKQSETILASKCTTV